MKVADHKNLQEFEKTKMDRGRKIEIIKDDGRGIQDTSSLYFIIFWALIHVEPTFDPNDAAYTHT